MRSDEDIEARLARQRMRSPRAGLREEILARAAEARVPRRRPWFACAVTATIVLALVVGQIADHFQSRRIAALSGRTRPVSVAADRTPGGRAETVGMAALLRRQAEMDALMAGPEWPNGRVGG